MHRFRQFREAHEGPSAADALLARESLPGPLLALWEGQTARDRRHSAATARWLLERGHRDPVLVQAALLHDIGKGPQRRWDRVAWVLTDAAGAGAIASSTTSRFELRRALARSAAHSALGAAQLRQAGAPERVVDLTLRHHDRETEDGMLALLQVADART